ncbi:MAG: squalene--hopene cyclase [Verrucomicrobiae bacterium]|nr:squalene--hopene cyclase [Verrucomicrobiae bacterium]
MTIDRERLLETLTSAREHLLAERNPQGHWSGELSTSALSTATAVVALGLVDGELHRGHVTAACRWLLENRNEDGGWGDTVKSFSNVSTTLLCWSALSRFGGKEAEGAVVAASHWIRDYVGSLDPALIAETVKARYGKDRTFSVPILMLCAICGTLGPRGWDHVMQMPHWLAALPRSWFAALRLPVVSYALPALISIGYAKSRVSLPRRNKGWTDPLWPRLSRLLTSIQPASGGFLEAAPLTSFVTMALVSAGEREHPVVKGGVRFLLETVRPDGSWPIDTNLATWVTTLAVKALGVSKEGSAVDSTLFDGQDAVKRWLLGQQYHERHPFTDVAPGGWAWTDLSGGVPDADDTPGALLALKTLTRGLSDPETVAAARAGVVWLLDLQNRDGGIPTFCRGWGALPFDRSSPDLTAHSLRAWEAWRDVTSEDVRSRIDSATERALAFLRREQRSDGSWRPLWFGNQHRRDDEENPVYGTAKVLLALSRRDEVRAEVVRGARWLLEHQGEDGGWGSVRAGTLSSIEETALALAALADLPRGVLPEAERRSALVRGFDWLEAATQRGTFFEASPIGFYFAKLWYYERAYPVVWTVDALGRLANLPDFSGESAEAEYAPNRLRSTKV